MDAMYERVLRARRAQTEMVVACVLEAGSRGQPHKEIRTFGFDNTE